MSILLTGGLGFIGSHTAVELLNHGYDLIIVDNLNNSQLEVLDKIKQLTQNSKASITFYQVDILDIIEMNNIIQKHQIISVIHFAAYKSVSESIIKPLDYYHNNITGLINLLSLCKSNDINQLIFSSSATVYGNVNQPPLLESSVVGQGLTNPYGQTKFMSETILRDSCLSNFKLQVICLRYFNPVGAHPSGLIGENPAGIPNNLMPFIVRTAIKNNLDSFLNDSYSELKIFGCNYSTPDKTAIRDFIHVVDLAQAHLCALQRIQRPLAEYQTNSNSDNFKVYNIGTGKGYSVKQLVDSFTQVNQVKLPFKYVQEREGDIPEVFCDASKAQKELRWTASKTIDDICRDAYNFAKKKY